jgi:hypothetical protein
MMLLRACFERFPCFGPWLKKTRQKNAKNRKKTEQKQKPSSQSWRFGRFLNNRQLLLLLVNLGTTILFPHETTIIA